MGRPMLAAPPVRFCEHCHGPIKYDHLRRQRYPTQRFCSKQCCGKYHCGDRHGSWKGGLIDDQGYRRASIYAFPEEHRHLLWSMRRKHRIDMAEHRAVMAIALGRSLTPEETVHHINGDKLDNRPENLQLHAGPHGRGATASALTCPHCHKKYDDPTY